MRHRRPASLVATLLFASIGPLVRGARADVVEGQDPHEPIVPREWLVLPESGEDHPEVRELVVEYLLDEESRKPGVGEVGLAARQGPRWERRRAGVGALDVACAQARISCAADEIRMARLTGAGLLFANGAGFVGDHERRGFRGVPVVLEEGENELYVMDIDGSFELELWSPPARVVLGTWDVRWPAVTRELASWIPPEISYPAFNASMQEIQYLHVHYGHAAAIDGSDPPHISDWRDGGVVAPLGIHLASSYFGDLFGEPSEPVTLAHRARVPVHVYEFGEGCGSSATDGEFAMLEGPLLEPGAEQPQPKYSGRGLGALKSGVLGRHFAPGLHLVYGTREVEGRPALDLELARYQQQLIWYRAGVTPIVMSDREFLRRQGAGAGTAISEDRKERVRTSTSVYRNVILYGTPESNAAWELVVPADDPLPVRPGSLGLSEDDHVGNDLVGWSRVGKQGALAVTYTGVAGARLAYALDLLSLPVGEVDFAFYDRSAARVARPEPRISGRLR